MCLQNQNGSLLAPTAESNKGIVLFLVRGCENVFNEPGLHRFYSATLCMWQRTCWPVFLRVPIRWGRDNPLHFFLPFLGNGKWEQSAECNGWNTAWRSTGHPTVPVAEASATEACRQVAQQTEFPGTHRKCYLEKWNESTSFHDFRIIPFAFKLNQIIKMARTRTGTWLLKGAVSILPPLGLCTHFVILPQCILSFYFSILWFFCYSKILKDKIQSFWSEFCSIYHQGFTFQRWYPRFSSRGP